MTKTVTFRGTALTDLCRFPPSARREAGYQLDKVQNGEQPNDSKPMPTIGAGVSELRIRDVAGAFRVVYVAKFEQSVHVLHCFQKKTQQTSQADMALASKRYREIYQEQQHERTQNKRPDL